VRPRQGRQHNPVRMPVDVYVHEHPPSPTEPDNSNVSRLRLNSGGGAAPLTVVTCPRADIWCTFHMVTVPKESATTATSGIQTRAKTVLPTERGLTESADYAPMVLSAYFFGLT
jgi:hypothetical protein